VSRGQAGGDGEARRTEPEVRNAESRNGDIAQGQQSHPHQIGVLGAL